MKNLLFALLLATLATACQKSEGDASAVFYTTNSLHGDMDVYVEGNYKGTLSQAFSGAPSCGSSTSSKVLNVNLDAGTYRWAALGEDGSTFYASFTLDADGCHLQVIP